MKFTNVIIVYPVFKYFSEASPGIEDIYHTCYYLHTHHNVALGYLHLL